MKKLLIGSMLTILSFNCFADFESNSMPYVCRLKCSNSDLSSLYVNGNGETNFRVRSTRVFYTTTPDSLNEGTYRSTDEGILSVTQNDIICGYYLNIVEGRDYVERLIPDTARSTTSKLDASNTAVPLTGKYRVEYIDENGKYDGAYGQIFNSKPILKTHESLKSDMKNILKELKEDQICK